MNFFGEVEKNPPVDPEKEAKLESARKKRELREERHAVRLKMARDHTQKLKRDHLSRELKMGKHAFTEIMKKQSELMSKLKTGELKRSIELLWETINNTVDMKDMSANLLLDELESIDEEYHKNFRAHLQTIEGFINLYQRRIQEMQQDYKTKLNSILDQDKEFIKTQMESYDTEEYNFNLIYYEMEKRNAQWLGLIDEEKLPILLIEKQMDDEDKKDLDSAFTLRWNPMFTKYMDFLEMYHANVDETLTRYREMKEKDERDAQILKRQTIKMDYLHETIHKMEQYNFDLQENHEEKVSDLKYQRKFLTQYYCQIRDELKEHHEDDYRRLKLLSIQSNMTTSRLQKLVEKREKILKLAAKCRKFEMQKEKVLPFLREKACYYKNDSLNDIDCENDKKEIDGNDSINETGTTIKIKIQDEFIKNTTNSLKELKNFWLCVAQADMTRTSLKQEHDKLELENKYLRQLVKCYLSEAPCNAIPSLQADDDDVDYESKIKYNKKLTEKKGLQPTVVSIPNPISLPPITAKNVGYDKFAKRNRIFKNLSF
uniref:Dynein regulatory complex subunit 2 n=1 Tax=Timema poppense TaxID=170557 RepID=A0A7R9DEH5_TIMPO|nr:unnamed protein product [Timema poppensis]